MVVRIQRRDDASGPGPDAERRWTLPSEAPYASGSTVAEMMMVSDLRHFLDLPDDAPAPARRIAERLTLIVRAATAGDSGAEWVSALTCDRRPGRKRCPGHYAVLRTDVPPSIAWRCPSCGDEGVISGWERSPCDLRPRRPRPTSIAARRIVIPAGAGAALRSLLLLDSDMERLVFRAEVSEDGIVIAGDDDDLDELMGYVAAEANHEEDRRRQRRLDDAFDILRRAIEGPA